MTKICETEGHNYIQIVTHSTATKDMKRTGQMVDSAKEEAEGRTYTTMFCTRCGDQVHVKHMKG